MGCGLLPLLEANKQAHRPKGISIVTIATTGAGEKSSIKKPMFVRKVATAPQINIILKPERMNCRTVSIYGIGVKMPIRNKLSIKSVVLKELDCASKTL